MRIGLASIFVNDQDRAERFYTEVLGLTVKTNASYGPGERWLTVVSPEDPDGVQLVLPLRQVRELALNSQQRGARGLSRAAPRLHLDRDRLSFFAVLLGTRARGVDGTSDADDLDRMPLEGAFSLIDTEAPDFARLATASCRRRSACSTATATARSAWTRSSPNRAWPR